jgi:uncharacterized protein YbjT (DUF2867 family)
MTDKIILLTGATGYIGGRLLKTLEAEGRSVRCLARRPEYLQSRVAETTSVVQGDLLDLASLEAALEGVSVAYYLVHSMGSTGEFEEEERETAHNFVQAAEAAGVQRIVYLGGLGKDEDLSAHLSSRQAVGKILRESSVPTIEFRASIIIGSGSLSFEMIRALVEKLPVMIAPRWVRTRAQPIAIEDVLAYLVAAADIELEASEIIEIGGTDQVSYQQLMREYARQRRLPRLIIPVPLLTPRLSSLWLGLVTPVYARIGRKLVDSLKHETTVTSPRAMELFDIQPRNVRQSIQRALANEDQEFAETRWSDALSMQGTPRNWGGVKFGARLVDSRTVQVPVSPEVAFTPIRRIGGRTGWYYGNRLWKLRGFMDILVGGAGLRRGRRDSEYALPGETIDFWRVEEIQSDRLLRLLAEMKVPGRAWLQFEVEESDGGSTIRQTAIFDPVGALGLAYWYLLFPLHQFVFAGMLRGIADAARRV